MSNAKSAIMVPIVTLAVCAIAMVGLGFALTTSVTSNTNAVEKLMIDMSSTENGLGQNAPTSTPVDTILKIGIKTDKDSQHNGLVYSIDENNKGEAFIKIYGNTGITKLSVTVTDTETTEDVPNSVKLALYTTDGDQRISEADISGGEAVFTNVNALSCGTVYKVKIVEFCGFIYTDPTGGSNGGWAGNGSEVTKAHNLTFTFEATNDPQTT